MTEWFEFQPIQQVQENINNIIMMLFVVASLGWQSGHCEPVLSLTATTVKDATVIQGSLSLSFALLSLTVFSPLRSVGSWPLISSPVSRCQW